MTATRLTQDPLTDLHVRYRYVPDRTRDRWTVLTAPEGPLEGDCEDYALTALWHVAGCSWARFWWLVITFQAVIWFARFETNGQGHAVLWVRGRGWTDSFYQFWAPRTRHSRVFPYLAPFLALVMIVK